MPISYPYSRQNPYLGAFVFFLSRRKFIEMAVHHGMACNLEAEDQRTRAEAGGSQLLSQWEEQYRSGYTTMTNEINVALWSSFFTIVIVIAIALGFAAFIGRFDPSLPLDMVRTITFVGSALIAWATLMELGGDFPVWDGKAFPQLAHTVIFKTIFVPGVLLVLSSVLL